MSSFFTLETQSLFMVTGEAAQSTPRPNAARASETPVRSARRTSDRVTERADSTRSRSGSRVSTASTSPALKALAHGPPMPPPPPRKASPVGRRQHTLRRRSSPAVPSSRSRSPSTSASDSEDDFVYVLPHVSTAEEAVARIRAVQQPREERRSRFFGGGGGGSAASLMEHVATSPDRRRTPKKMKGGLPATMEEFYECPRYTVSLTAARDAIFSDALSGFHSYVAREEAQRERLRTLQHHHQTQQDHRGKAPGTAEPPAHHLRSLDTRAGTARTSAIPSFSQSMTQEWSTALAASSAPTTDSGGPPAEARNCTHEGVDGWRTGATPSVAPNPTPSPATAAETSKAGGGGGGGGGDVVPEPSSPRVPASYMFLMRSRDTEAMSPLSPGHTAEPGSAASECVPASAASAHVTSTVHADPATSASPSAERRETTHGGPSQGRETEQAVRLELMQLHALLQERLYQRARVPEVFRYRYSTDFAETIEENKLRHQQRDRALRSHERQVSPRGLTPAERHDIARRFADPNTLACEWPYVWEQFERDIPRETLFIEDTAYRNADDALAAILSYVEYCYDRGQQHIQEKSAAALAAARSSDAAPTTPTTAAAAAGGDTASPPRERTFFESFFSASTAAIKGAVVTMRASLPDFVGDPLLSVSGYDPALYHASRLFPTDPRARSERIFSAVREVVLASQQSFMGFPYQLLCEQVGTERLGLALEALERDQDEDDGDLDEETAQGAIPPEEPRNAEPPEAEVASPCVVSAPIPIARTDEAELTGRASSSAMHSPLRGSRVLRVYHSFSTSSLTNRAANEPRHHHHHHTAHAVDEWDVSSTSSPVSDVAPSTMTPDGSPTVASRTTASPATVTPPPPPPPPPPPNGDDVVTERHRSAMESSNRKPLTRPPPLRETTRQPPAAPPGALAHGVSDEDRRRKDDMARRRRERRRRRRGQLPLLVGEPRPHEFAAFLDLLRSRVLAKQVKEDRKAKEQHRRERVQRMLERQREQWLSAPASQHGSRRVSRHTSSTSIDTMKQTDVAPPALTSHHAEVAATTPRSLFRDDVEGSAYLIPTQSPTAPVEPIVRSPQPPLSSALTREVATSPEMRGMRICLFFDAKRNVPMVMVNKLFRLFTVPGLRGLTSSEDDNERRATAAEELEGEIAEEEESAARRGDGRRAATANLVGRGRVGGVEKSLLLLIQVQFSLFTHEEAEVRWKWWKL
ncbi:hypothetical protein NESM_000709900 [Novymonas esmeraldas]|uniref:Uncharacterized protein n=1 Tax=Novymonas esmeraldas TaxID=1808958 RepID=A0AAW0ETU7_9TRYP